MRPSCNTTTVLEGRIPRYAGLSYQLGVAKLTEDEQIQQDKYELLDGVRRAKAYSLAGQEAVPVRIDDAGKLGPIINVPLDSLYSPKKVIETSGAGFMRWRKVLRAVEAGAFASGDPVPPLEVKRGSRGTPIRAVVVEGEDEIERLF